MLSLLMAMCFPRYPSKREAHKWAWDGIMARTACTHPEQVEFPEPMGMAQPKTGGINTTSAGVQEETRRALQRETACCIWAGYWCLSVTGAACCWFLVHCAELSRGWEPSTWATAAARCQREAHSTKMGELCFSEPLHFCSCLTYFKGESLQLIF